MSKKTGIGIGVAALAAGAGADTLLRAARAAAAWEGADGTVG